MRKQRFAARQCRQWHDFHPIRERVAHGPGTENGDPFQPHVGQGVSDRGRDPGRIGPLVVDAVQASTVLQDQVNSGSLMGGPKESMVMGFGGKHLLDGKSRPGRFQLGMGKQRLFRRDPEQLMQQARVADVDFRRLHLAFF